MCHLCKPKRRGHLAIDATLAGYEQIIRSVLLNQTATAYLYKYDNVSFDENVKDDTDQACKIDVACH